MGLEISGEGLKVGAADAGRRCGSRHRRREGIMVRIDRA